MEKPGGCVHVSGWSSPSDIHQFGCASRTDGQSYVKEVMLDYFGPFIQFVDQYATLCDEVISAFARAVLRFFDTVTMVRSPIEIIWSALIALPSLILSLIGSILYVIFYVITLPFRLFFLFIYYHPFVFFVLLLFIMLTIFAIMVFLRRVSISRLYNVWWRTIAPYVYAIARALIPILFPQLNTLLNIVQLIFAPFIFLFEFIISIPTRLMGIRYMQPITRSTIRRSSLPSEDSIDEPARGERLLCCVCLLREKSILLQPCNHICLCSLCSMQLMRTFDPHCPLCRSKIRSYVDVYI